MLICPRRRKHHSAGVFALRLMACLRWLVLMLRFPGKCCFIQKESLGRQVTVPVKGDMVRMMPPDRLFAASQFITHFL